MRIREHHSHHATVEELPLLTESATVTDVSAMDRNRNDEVLAELRETLDEYGTDAWHRDRPGGEEACEDLIRDLLDPIDHVEGGTPLDRYLSEDRRSGAVGEKLAALQGRYLQPYPALLAITVETDEPIAFVPGQYISVRYEDTTRVYSIASSPTREEMEFCVSRVPGGRMTSDLAVDLDEGETVTLRGPYGELVLDDPSPRDVVFLATGTGVAPFKSMIDYIFETGRDRYEGDRRDVWLILGADWRDTLPYREAFRSYATDRENFHFLPTLTSEPHLTDWDGETAYVQYVLAKYLAEEALSNQSLPDDVEPYRDEPPRYSVDARLDPTEMQVYGCGLTAMITSLAAVVERIGVPPEHAQFEGFG